MLPDLAMLAAGKARVDLSGVDVLVHRATITQSTRNMTEVQRLHLFAVNAASTAMQTVIIRAPRVYGPGVGGSFRQLIKLSARGLSLQLGRDAAL
jgi:hypothetical protein